MIYSLTYWGDHYLANTDEGGSWLLLATCPIYGFGISDGVPLDVYESVGNGLLDGKWEDGEGKDGHKFVFTSPLWGCRPISSVIKIDLK